MWGLDPGELIAADYGVIIVTIVLMEIIFLNSFWESVSVLLSVSNGIHTEVNANHL